MANLAWGAMALGIAILLGGTAIVGTTAFLTTIVIVAMNRRLARIGTPIFFQQMVGGFIAVPPAAGLYHWRETLDLAFAPSQIIAAGIVVLLSGLSLVGSVQDAITGAPITGTARFSEVVLMTGGILAGVGLAIRLVETVDVNLPGLTTSSPFGPSAPVSSLLGGAIAAGAFAAASYAERRAIPVARRGHARVRRRERAVVHRGRSDRRERDRRRGGRTHRRPGRTSSPGPATGGRGRGHHTPAARPGDVPRSLRGDERTDDSRSPRTRHRADRRLFHRRRSHPRRVHRPHAQTSATAVRTDPPANPASRESLRELDLTRRKPPRSKT